MHLEKTSIFFIIKQYFKDIETSFFLLSKSKDRESTRIYFLNMKNAWKRLYIFSIEHTIYDFAK